MLCYLYKRQANSLKVIEKNVFNTDNAQSMGMIRFILCFPGFCITPNWAKRLRIMTAKKDLVLFHRLNSRNSLLNASCDLDLEASAVSNIDRSSV